jgi:hypothetical protein
MKWWAWMAAATAAVAVVVLLAGKEDIRRFRQMKRL